MKKSAANAGSMVYEFSGHDRRFHNLRQFFLHDAWMQIYMHAWYTGKIDWIGSMNFKDRSFTRFTTIVGEDHIFTTIKNIYDFRSSHTTAVNCIYEFIFKFNIEFTTIVWDDRKSYFSLLCIVLRRMAFAEGTL